ncbi:MAG: hypothetical protein ACOC83_01730 [Gemmatimonadota bacterium]
MKLSRTLRRSVPVLFVAPFLTLLPATAQSQSAGEILQTALERYEARTEGIDNYTVIQEVMGLSTTTYFEKESVDGHPVFRMSSSSVQGMGESDDLDDEAVTNPYQFLPELTERATLDGSETVDGLDTWAVSVEDFSGLDFGAPTGDEGDFRPTRGVFYLDKDDYLLRQMRVEGELEREGESAPVTMVARIGDYREVEGLLHPFRIDMQIEGITAAVSEEERAEMEQQMEQLQQQLESMPESQREMAEGMMGPQLEQMREMLSSGAMEMTLEVTELRVNEGPPGGS